MSNLVNINNDVNDLNANISECVPNGVLCNTINLCTNTNNIKNNISPNIFTKSRCQAKYNSNLSESHILENPGQDSKEKSWSSYTSILSSNSSLRPKEPKYKFPSVDPPPTEGLVQHSPKDLYIFLINLCYHRLHPDTYKQWCDLTERDVAFPEMTKDGVLESSYSLKNQREQFKKSIKKKAIINESNILLSKVEEMKTISKEILEKLQNITMNISMYLLQRDEYIQFLNQLLEINFSPPFNKLLNRMIKLASLKQDINCQKIKAMHTKLVKIHKNSFLDRSKVIYRCSASLLSDHDNLKLPWVTCILDINRAGKAGQIVPCMIDSGSQISVCSYDMFVNLGGDPKNLDRSKAVTIAALQK